MKKALDTMRRKRETEVIYWPVDRADLPVLPCGYWVEYAGAWNVPDPRSYGRGRGRVHCHVFVLFDLETVRGLIAAA